MTGRQFAGGIEVYPYLLPTQCSSYCPQSKLAGTWGEGGKELNFSLFASLSP